MRYLGQNTQKKCNGVEWYGSTYAPQDQSTISSGQRMSAGTSAPSLHANELLIHKTQCVLYGYIVMKTFTSHSLFHSHFFVRVGWGREARVRQNSRLILRNGTTKNEAKSKTIPYPEDGIDWRKRAEFWRLFLCSCGTMHFVKSDSLNHDIFTFLKKNLCQKYALSVENLKKFKLWRLLPR